VYWKEINLILCETVKAISKESKENCYWRYNQRVEQHQKIKECKKISINNGKKGDQCYYQNAKKYRNADLCDNIKNSSLRESCLQEFLPILHEFPYD